jgi:hypothetical protein
MHARLLITALAVVVGSGAVFGAASAQSKPEEADPSKARQAEDEVRAAMGLGPMPTVSNLVRVGAALMTPDESRSMTKYQELIMATQGAMASLTADERVVHARYTGGILDPGLLVVLGRDSEDIDAATIARMVPQDLPVATLKSRWNRSEVENTVETLRSSAFDPDWQAGARFADKRPAVVVELANNNVLINHVSFGGRVNQPWNDSVEVFVDPGKVVEAQQVFAKGTDKSLSIGTVNYRVQAGPRATPAVSRQSPEGVARGGKAFANDCTSGPTVWDVAAAGQQGYVLSAGHCGDGATPTLGGVATPTVTSCYFCTAWNDGRDYKLMSLPFPSSVTASPYFIHQDWGTWNGYYQSQGQTFFALQYGAFNVYSGVHNICIEGASQWRYGGSVEGLDARTSCGLANNWWDNGLFSVIMYPQQPVCQGDSGGFIRHTALGQTFAAGVLSMIWATEFTRMAATGCFRHRQVGAQQEWPFALISQYWNIHTHQQSLGRVIWPKTW